MQNNELRQIHQELDASKTRYFNLYDLAPVGYLTLDQDGMILECNLASARLLGLNRAEMTAIRPCAGRYAAVDHTGALEVIDPNAKT